MTEQAPPSERDQASAASRAQEIERALFKSEERFRQVVESAPNAPGYEGIGAGQYICIAVTDSGCGMDHETIDQAFEPFFTTKPIGQGTGLGLSMVYGFARQSQGYARLKSEVGRGTTASLYLPRFHGEVPADSGDVAPAPLLKKLEGLSHIDLLLTDVGLPGR